jgi:hypothetical protein
MKSKLLFSSRLQIATQVWVLGVACFVSGLASAQNFVRNPDFEEELGPDNWTVVYAPVDHMTGGIIAANCPTNCGPNDFLVKGRNCLAHRNLGVPSSGTWDGGWSWNNYTYWNKFGARFQPNHNWGMHAYFKQVVTNLTPGASYSISAWMTMFGRTDKTDVYLQAIGGLGSRRTVNVMTSAINNPAAWQSYALSNTADTNGQIEVRLHMNKAYTTTDWVYLEVNAFFDHVAVVAVGQPTYMPPYNILAFTRTNQDISLTWQTVMNNRYRLQSSTDLSTWSWVQRAPTLDTNFLATGTAITFKTNLTSLFTYDPNFDPTAPLFFRIYSTPFTVP